MANPNESQQQTENQQQQPNQLETDSLMADMYYGTPMGMDNNSGEFNVTEATSEETKNRIS